MVFSKCGSWKVITFDGDLNTDQAAVTDDGGNHWPALIRFWFSFTSIIHSLIYSFIHSSIQSWYKQISSTLLNGSGCYGSQMPFIEAVGNNKEDQWRDGGCCCFVFSLFFFFYISTLQKVGQKYSHDLSFDSVELSRDAVYRQYLKYWEISL